MERFAAARADSVAGPREPPHQACFAAVAVAAAAAGETAAAEGTAVEVAAVVVAAVVVAVVAAAAGSMVESLEADSCLIGPATSMAVTGCSGCLGDSAGPDPRPAGSADHH